MWIFSIQWKHRLYFFQLVFNFSVKISDISSYLAKYFAFTFLVYYAVFLYSSGVLRNSSWDEPRLEKYSTNSFPETASICVWSLYKEHLLISIILAHFMTSCLRGRSSHSLYLCLVPPNTSKKMYDHISEPDKWHNLVITPIFTSYWI